MIPSAKLQPWAETRNVDRALHSRPMSRIQLLHWKEAEGCQRAKELRAAGFRVEYEVDAHAALSVAKEDLPDALVIDLTRLPSHGREIARGVRQHGRMRALPLVFVGGDPAKVARIRGELPDATFTDWDGAAQAIERAIASPPRDPVVPRDPSFYTSKPLSAKLGIAPGSRVALVEAPRGFEQALEPLPERAKLARGPRGRCDLVLWFVESRRELERALPRMVALASAGSLVWVAWPKKGARIESDLDQTFVRRSFHERGLVDFKICALDEDWSGMCFVQRKEPRKRSVRQ